MWEKNSTINCGTKNKKAKVPLVPPLENVSRRITQHKFNVSTSWRYHIR